MINEHIIHCSALVVDSSESNADAMMELEQAMQEAGWFAQTLSIVNPHAIKVVITTNQDTMLPDEVLSKDPVRLQVFYFGRCNS